MVQYAQRYAGRGWVHWGNGTLSDGQWNVDFLPDVSEFDSDELCDTGIKHRDGTPVRVFSSYNPKTVSRHFKWMRDYGIDGVFLQRFADCVDNPQILPQFNRVTDNVRAGAQTYGRTWGMMYDLTGIKVGNIGKVIDDWKRLVGKDHITQDKQYIHQNGKPVVVLWGFGFGDGTSAQRPDLFEDGLKLINFLKSDPVYGDNTVMVGLPHWWRERIEKKQQNYQAFEKLLAAADILQPWAVGAFGTPEQAIGNARNKWAPDNAWCQAHGKLYMPVVFPGSSNHNMEYGKAPSDPVPRLGGKFLWTQYTEAKKLGIRTVYQAMFDEVDEGTAILKITKDLPSPGQSIFVGTHGLPGDFYLKLVGEATRLIHGDITASQEMLIHKSSDSEGIHPIDAIGCTSFFKSGNVYCFARLRRIYVP